MGAEEPFQIKSPEDNERLRGANKGLERADLASYSATFVPVQ
jgi:hypothetical protein